MYNVIIELTYGDVIKIPCVELIDLMQILPVIHKMKLFSYDKEKDIRIRLEPVKVEMVKDGES